MTTTSELKTRVPQAVRSAKMRERLTEAAFTVINEVGFANFRTSAVSKEAGVSQGAQLHHFPTKDSLAIAAMEYAYHKAHEQFIHNFSKTAEQEGLLALIIKDFKDYFMSDYFMVALDILMGGGKNETLRVELVDMALTNRGQIERSWLERLIDDGWPLTDAEDFLAITHNIVRGFAVRSLVDKNITDFDRRMQRWQTMVIASRKHPA